MINDRDIDYWKRFVRNWVLVDDVQEVPEFDPASYGYVSIDSEIKNLIEDDDDDDID